MKKIPMRMCVVTRERFPKQELSRVVVNKEGKQEIRDIVEFGINLDERIADGAYMSKAVNLLNYIMTHPETLDEPLKTIYEGKDYFTYE